MCYYVQPVSHLIRKLSLCYYLNHMDTYVMNFPFLHLEYKLHFANNDSPKIISCLVALLASIFRKKCSTYNIRL